MGRGPESQTRGPAARRARKWCGERDLNPQRAAPKATAYAISPSPHEIERRGETTPFIAGLWSDYACQQDSFPGVSTSAAIKPTA